MTMQLSNRTKFISVGVLFILLLLMFGQYSSTFLTIDNESLKSENPISETPVNYGTGGFSKNIIMSISMANTSEKILVYRTIPHQYTRQDIITSAGKFNINTSGRIKESPEGSSIASGDGTIYLIMKNSGSIEYTNSNRAHTVNPLDIPENLPSDEDAERIASNFLKERDLLPADAICIGTEHERAYRLGNDGKDVVIWEDVNVWYGRLLNGYKVTGSQLSIAIGGNGDIIDYYRNWREYEPYQEMPVKTPEMAFEDLKNKGVAVGMNKPDKVTISDMYLAYRTKPGAETEEYLEPVWVFKGDVIADNKSVMPVNAYIPALTNDAVKSLSLE